MTVKKLLLISIITLVAASCGNRTAEQNDTFYVISNKGGMELVLTNYGGRIVSLNVPDRDGNLRDVVLGFDSVKDYYPENNESDFGATIGRYANRIDSGHFSLDGTEYTLPSNNFGHCLHGGPTGWQYCSYTLVSQSPNSVQLKIDSPDGDNGFPGNVTAFVTFTLTDDNSLDIVYEATTDAPTIINMTNHSYFNLAGDPASHSVTEDYLMVNASAFTPVDSTFMTTGEILPVEGTPFDFRTPVKIGARIDEDNEQLRNGMGYDHNWVLDTAGDISIPAAEVYCEESGIVLTVYTNEPGIQIYSGNFLDGSVTGKGGVVYGQRSGLCLETQHYPDSPNKPEWPSVVLRPGETYTSRCIFAFSVADAQ